MRQYVDLQVTLTGHVLKGTKSITAHDATSSDITRVSEVMCRKYIQCMGRGGVGWGTCIASSWRRRGRVASGMLAARSWWRASAPWQRCSRSRTSLCNPSSLPPTHPPPSDTCTTTDTKHNKHTTEEEEEEEELGEEGEDNGEQEEEGTGEETCCLPSETCLRGRKREGRRDCQGSACQQG